VEGLDAKRIKHAEIRLNGVEYSRARRLDKTNVVQSYKQVLFPDSSKKLETFGNNNSSSNYNRSATSIAFEIHIPEEAKRSYEAIQEVKATREAQPSKGRSIHHDMPYGL
jgi:hypothetical protein